MNREKWALITGASSGIGMSLALRFAKDGWQLVLVARDAARLSALSEIIEDNSHVRTFIIQKDLTSPTAAAEIFEQLDQNGIQLDALINNAGAGACGLFHDIPSEQDTQMIDLNIRAVTSLSRLAISHMRQAGGGKILNVASTGSYQPGPYIAVYYASKAFVLSFSQALRKELKKSGIIVSTLCPGSTATEFSQRAGKADIKGAMTPEKVSDCAYKGLMKGKAVIIPGFQNKIFIVFSKLMPGSLSAAIVARIQRKLTEAF